MRSAASLAAAAAAVVAALLAWRRARDTEMRLHEMQRQVEEAQANANHTELQRQGERRGRVAAEKELRRVMEEKLDTSSGLYVQSLGHVHSCFRSCVGTPRQGLFAPSTRGKIVFQRNVSPDALIGLDHFSHLWIVFEFHKNTNGKNARAHVGLRSDSHRFTFKAKVSPPRLKERVGIFSTRSPHRPNPIGMTLAKIEQVDGRNRTVHLSALDLIDGTPVLDIKPYVPAYDSLPSASIASWVSDDLSPTLHTVRWTEPSLLLELERLALASRFYKNDPSGFRAAVDEVLQVDVRSKDQTSKRQHTARNELILDNARIVYRVVSSSDDDQIEIITVENVVATPPSVAISPDTSVIE